MNFLKIKFPENLENFIFKIKKKMYIFWVVIKHIAQVTYIAFSAWWYHQFEDKSFSEEMKSLLVSCIVAFFFYYFIVIELSILIFGYSLLCYGFLFIFIFISLIISWRLEVFLLQQLLYENERTYSTIEDWYWYYDGKAPFTLYNYITKYGHKAFFGYIVIQPNIDEVEDTGLFNSVFFFLFCFTFFYFCSYRFWPKYLEFVSHWFYPVVNFFEIRSEPRLVDWYSVLIRFRNRLVLHLEYKYGDQPNKLALLEKIPTAPAKWEAKANGIWFNKISLRKTSNFGDIFFLGELGTHYPVYKLVFSYDQPTHLADRFDHNIGVYFLGFIGGQLDSSGKNYWVKYFKDDPLMWEYLLEFRDFQIQKIGEMEAWTPLYYFDEDYAIPTFYDKLLNQNYFDNNLSATNKSFYDYGAHGEIFDNLIYPKFKGYMMDFPTIQQSFTKFMAIPVPQSYFGLGGHHKQTGDPYEKYFYKTEKEKERTIMYKIFKKGGFNLTILKNLLTQRNFDVAMHNYNSYPELEEIADLTPENIKDATKDELAKYLKKLDWRLAVLEEKYSLEPMVFNNLDYNTITWNHLITLLIGRVGRLDTYINNGNMFILLKNKIPTFHELSESLNSAYQPHWGMEKIYEKVKKLGMKIYIPPKKENIQDILILEKIVRDFEGTANLWHPFPNYLEGSWEHYKDLTHEPRTNGFILNNPSFFPWYVGSIKYFNSLDLKIPFPGFVGFYIPTPYPVPFSTIGLNWFGFQIFGNKNPSLFTTESISFANEKHSNPTITYTGVEAIMYFKPILKIFEFVSKHMIGLFSYPLEFVATSIPVISEKLSLLVFLVHLTWFLHFYIYVFLFMYVFYYFAKYYYYRANYMWIYEGMFETAFINQNNGFVYWHNLTDIWKNYKDPYQFTILSMQTSLLLSYSFNNFLNFTVITKLGTLNFLNFLSLFFSESKNVINYFYNYKDSTSTFKNLLSIENFKFFKFFFNINYLKYNMLLFDGGVDCNSDFLIWDYFDYLCQTSIFISGSLIKNKYFYFLNKGFVTLMKHATILFSSQSVSPNFYFLSMPILDTSISGKIFEEFIYMLEVENFKCEKSKIFVSQYLLNKNEFESTLKNSLFLNLGFNFLNFFTKSGLEFYKLFDSKEFNFNSNFNKNNFGDSEKYWLFAFFGSFGFVPKSGYPFLNLSLTHEINGLQLGGMAYSNSWIGATINVGPYFNMIQHIWWTSGVYNRAYSLTDNYLNLHSAGINVFDKVGNFFEKRYIKTKQNKVETIFGAVGTLTGCFGEGNIEYLTSNANPSFKWYKTYPKTTINNVTTKGDYDKTNPPLNLSELDITPHGLFSFFKDFPIGYMLTYLTFFDQLEYIDNSTYKLLKSELKEEYLYNWIPEINRVFLNKNPKGSSLFDFYLKKFDTHLAINNKKFTKNWIFSFDTSYFFNHFLSWDYIYDNQEYLKFPNIENEGQKNKIFFFLKNQSFSEINAGYNISNHWFDKPFGVLDGYELLGMQGYKSVKNLDTLSFTSNKENTFNFLEKETLKKISGLSVLDFEDGGTASDAYGERGFLAGGKTGFSINNSLISNTPQPILLGWVGEIYNATIDSTSILFTTIYTADEFNPIAFGEKKKIYFKKVALNYVKEVNFQTFFNNSTVKNQLYSGLFSWLNLTLFSTSFGNFFGIKSLSRLDYWSWKCGIQIDYGHGFYNYRPYIGFGHSFGSKLMVFDSIYGFYGSYGQIEDDPTILDLDTDAMEQLYEEEEDNIFFEGTKMDYKEFYDVNNKEDRNILRDLSQTYGEVYFSFHHPFFLGYFLFWFFTFLTKEQYLGLVNFSVKRLILHKFISFNNPNGNLYFGFLFKEGGENENRFGRNMFGYGLYFVNSMKLTTNFINGIDQKTSTPSLKEDHILSSFFDLYETFDLINFSKTYTHFDLNLLLDNKFLDLQLLKINWYNMDMPFPLNPYIVVNKLMFNSFDLDYEKIYNLHFLSFSHHDSLGENVNLNLLFDEYLGSYFDSFNFISYYSTFRSLSTLPDHFLDKPNALATHNIGLRFESSKKKALDLISRKDSYDNQDMISSYGLVFQNLAFIKFFTSTLQFMLLLSANINEYKFLGNFLEFYFRKTEFGVEFMKLGTYKVDEADKPHSLIMYPVSSYISHQKHFLFLLQFCGYIPYDLLTIWLNFGVLFFSTKAFKNIFRLKKISLTNRFIFLKQFYNGIGYQLFIFYFQNKKK